MLINRNLMRGSAFCYFRSIAVCWFPGTIIKLVCFLTRIWVPFQFKLYCFSVCIRKFIKIKCNQRICLMSVYIAKRIMTEFNFIQIIKIYGKQIHKMFCSGISPRCTETQCKVSVFCYSNPVGYHFYVSIQQTPYFPLWKFFLVLREFKTWNNEELDIRRI